MTALAQQLADLVRRAATELPPDVSAALRAAREAEEPGSPAAAALGTILENAELARAGSVPACQDTGTPAFWFDLPDGTPTLPIREAAREAVAAATAAGHLRLNVIDVPSGRQVSSNFAPGSPALHFRFGPAGTPITAFLPAEPATVDAALLAGNALLETAPASPLRHSIAALAGAGVSSRRRSRWAAAGAK